MLQYLNVMTVISVVFDLPFNSSINIMLPQACHTSVSEAKFLRLQTFFCGFALRLPEDRLESPLFLHIHRKPIILESHTLYTRLLY
jgi:hypothetical protein